MVYCDWYVIKITMINLNVGEVTPITKGHYSIFFLKFLIFNFILNLTIATMKENDLNFGHFH